MLASEVVHSQSVAHFLGCHHFQTQFVLARILWVLIESLFTFTPLWFPSGRLPANMFM